MCELEDSISIHSKSMDYNMLTVDEGTASILIALVVGIIPAAYLIIGICIFVRRKRR